MRDLLLLNQNFKLKKKCLNLPCLCRDPQLVNGRTSWRLMVPEQSQCALLSPLHKGGLHMHVQETLSTFYAHPKIGIFIQFMTRFLGLFLSLNVILKYLVLNCCVLCMRYIYIKFPAQKTDTGNTQVIFSLYSSMSHSIHHQPFTKHVQAVCYEMKDFWIVTIKNQMAIDNSLPLIPNTS